MSESYILKEIEKYKEIIAQTQSEKQAVEREIEDTRQRIQEFRLNYRQHVCQQILAQKAAHAAANASAHPDNKSLPNHTNYLNVKTESGVDRTLPGAATAFLDSKINEFFQKSYQRDLALYEQLKVQRQESTPESYTLPTDQTQILSQVPRQDQNFNHPKPFDDARQKLTLRSQNDILEELAPIELVTIESENSVCHDDINGLTQGPYDGRTPLQPTKVTLNYSQTMQGEQFKTNPIPQLTSNIYEEDLEIPIDSDSSNVVPVDESDKILGHKTQEKSDDSAEKNQRFISKMAGVPGSLNATEQYRLIERSHEKNEDFRNFQQRLEEARSLEKRPPAEPFKKIFEEPLVTSKASSDPISEIARQSLAKKAQAGSSSKVSVESRVSNIKISYDNMALLDSQVSMADSAKQKPTPGSNKASLGYIEKNKEVMSKFDDFFKKNKNRKENMTEISLKSGKGAGADSRGAVGPGGENSERKCVYRYPHDN